MAHQPTNSDPGGGAERRSAPRVPIDLVIELYDESGNLLRGVGHLMDLSSSGARLRTQLLMSHQAEVRLHLRLGRGLLLQLEAKVVWRKDSGNEKHYGVELIRVSDEQKQGISNLLSKGGTIDMKETAKRSEGSSPRRGYNVGLIPGDGVGPECIAEGLKVLSAVEARFHFRIDWARYPYSGAHYLKTGEVLPDSALDEFRKLNAIYLGAVGHPDVKPGILEQGILLKTRFTLDQYINLRPVVLYPGVETPLKDRRPEEIDMVFIRENTEGPYVGMGGVFKKGTSDEVAIQEDINTRKGVERCVRFAYDYCVRRNKRKHLTLVDKANVLTYAHDLWRRTFAQLSKSYPEVKTDCHYVDACAMYMVKDPAMYDVIVTNNMFGDILTDLGAILQGGLGVAAGGNINPQGVSMFEPIHGSAPKFAGQGTINPIAAISSAGMMLEFIGETDAAEAIDQAIRKVLQSGVVRSMDVGKMGMTTAQVGDLIAKAI